jgi:hypothetical protein
MHNVPPPAASMPGLYADELLFHAVHPACAGAFHSVKSVGSRGVILSLSTSQHSRWARNHRWKTEGFMDA